MWDLITNAVAYFFTRIVTLGPWLIARVLAAMGIGYGVYAVALPLFVDFVSQFLSSQDPWVIELMGALKIDVFLTLIFSAYAAKLGIRVRTIKLAATSGQGP